ncbi:MAG: glycosyltransferase [Deltaproteobacteria bacterium]|jgi:glycosyltransferase|nr:glycosyltransferase [Deltaproteobacteria bacterium]
MNYPLISILSVFKNDKKMLKLVMNSVLEQNYPYVEHIIMDGASTDGSADLLKQYEEKYKQKGYGFVWKSEEDRNASHAYNKAAAILKGDYFIQFSNVFVSENSLKFLAEEIIDSGCNGVAAGYIFQKNGQVTRRWSGKQLPWRWGWMCATETFLVSSKSLAKYTLAEESFKRSYDYNFQLSLFTDPDFTIKSVPVPVTIFIAGGESNSGIRNNLKCIKYDYIALKNHKVFFPIFTVLGKCMMAFFGYLLASRSKLSPELDKKTHE